MELQRFYSALDARIAQHDLLCHPFYKAWSAGSLTRAELRAYAAQYYHHVAAFPGYLAALAERLPAGELRTSVIANRKKQAILQLILRRAVIWKPDLFVDDNLDTNALALAETLFEVLLSPKSRARPLARKHECNLVAASESLRVKE